MLENYLPKLATLSEACDWLKSEIGEMFTISRLIENGLMPWFWLDYSEQSSTLFDGRKEGYLAPIVFNGDTQRLSADKGDALVNWTRAFNGELREIIPPMRVALGD